MKVLIITPPRWIVPPKTYGGAERICDLLCSGLEERGHAVNLMAGPNSKVYSGATYCFRDGGCLPRIGGWWEFQRVALRFAQSADIIHTFLPHPRRHGLLRLVERPVIFNWQGPCHRSNLQEIIKWNPANGYLQGISHSQLSDCKASRHVNKVFMVYNATDTDIIRPVETPSRSYLAYLGRINYEKGTDRAVQIAKRAKIPLKIAGLVKENEQGALRLWNETIKPYLGNGVEYVGPITDSEKCVFLGNALALLMPNRWNEPFGIVMVEALSAGTPVIGTPRGSIPEIVDDGINGYLCEDDAEFVNAIHAVSALDARQCRESAIAAFSKERFIVNMMKMYNSILGSAAF